MDLKETSTEQSTAVIEAQERLFTVGSRLHKPLVAVVNGPALGGGTGLAAGCHIVIAGRNAEFGLTEIRLGLWPFVVFRAVTAAIGERRAIALALTAQRFGPEAARDMGLVHEIADDPMERGIALARQIENSSPSAIRNGLSFVADSRGKDWETIGEMAKLFRAQIYESPDFEEGVRAFFENRQPKWPSLGDGPTT
jgi:enoyl-CoA hydratase/carnithine racemase